MGDAPKKEVSEIFLDAFRAGMGTSDRVCDMCGRHVFADSVGYEEGELEGLQKAALAAPDKYVDLSGQCDGVSIGRIEGKYFVIGCPCNDDTLTRYENWIWLHRFQISQYLRIRAKMEMDQAKFQADTLAKTPGLGELP